MRHVSNILLWERIIKCERESKVSSTSGNPDRDSRRDLTPKSRDSRSGFLRESRESCGNPGIPVGIAGIVIPGFLRESRWSGFPRDSRRNPGILSGFPGILQESRDSRRGSRESRRESWPIGVEYPSLYSNLEGL